MFSDLWCLGSRNGRHLTSVGYVRFHQRGPLRNKREHRWVVETLARESGQSLPPQWDVHHMDFICSHNCPYNLLVMSASFHKAVGLRYNDFRRLDDGTYAPKWVARTNSDMNGDTPPDWVTGDLT